jgi:hypothetical protein
MRVTDGRGFTISPAVDVAGMRVTDPSVEMPSFMI